ncbi:hypothetical protein Z517_00118 [Fonsecaea pedrosoi CBS 271.37]|uniref:Glycosyltransferase 2-like domain-containing protein n=1 Tax=Fonsecaea pedrosoi CBS 271.37 TaxID=1442368 RepID=A0A0D2H1G3_9EURO|nr:uncharacterized protein Z517_00118 [Fonsecaea pedrosoi CBS 271.37]KIW84730.1 hypothetical protein Z517_00118 [Fonsecaea pedrosoi CBS 271.37]
MDSTTWFKVFVFYFLWRYVRLIVNLWAFWTFKPIPIPENPTLWPSDVTVILPTLDGEGEELEKTIASIMENEPKELILVTIDENLAKAERTMEKMPAAKYHRIRCMSVKHANKRRQMARAIPEVTTEIIVFADDDVTWPERTLQWMLAPFEDKRYGGVVTCQRLRRAENPTFSQRIYGFLGALYLERRNFDCAATTHVDGGVPCLSGRTCAYRTSILQDVNFTNGFTNEKWWFGQFQLNADDDNFLTRWMVSHRHETYMQYHPECEVLTTLEDNPKFLKQCLRWARSNWRSNLTSMFAERHIWRRQLYSAYAVHITTLMPPAILGDGLLWLCLIKGVRDWPVDQALTAIYAFAAWMIFSKFIKLVTHFVRYPVDIFLWPVSVLFGWFHGAIKIYAVVTLGVTTWGSRPNADASDSGRMIRQKKPHCYEPGDEKLHEKLLPNDEMMTYANDQKHYQPPSA